MRRKRPLESIEYMVKDCKYWFRKIATLRIDRARGDPAPHIHEFKDSRNNDPRNGMALSKNAHWQFDRGIWSLDDNYRVVLNREKFIEEGVPGHRLVDFEGKRAFLPSAPKYWPEHGYISWHRKQHGFSC